MQKEGFIYNSMKKYRRKFTVCMIVATALMIAFVIWRFPYIKTEFLGAKQLDVNKFLNDTSTFTIDETISLDRHDTKSPEAYYYKEMTYWQGNTFFFKINTENVKDTNITYTSKVKISSNNFYEYESAHIFLAEINGRKTAVIALPNQKIGKTIEGHLVTAPKAVIADLSNKYQNLTLSEYFIDCRGIDVGTESSDNTILKIWFVILAVLYIKLALYYANPYLTPTYRKLKRYGKPDIVASEIEEQLKSETSYTKSKKIYTDDYILSKETFKIKVIKNHLYN